MFQAIDNYIAGQPIELVHLKNLKIEEKKKEKKNKEEYKN